MKRSMSNSFQITAILSLLFISGIIFTGCLPDRPVIESEGGFPETPENLYMFNSGYDDYNSDLDPGVCENNTLIFSSNRNSEGLEFDLVLYSLAISYPFEEDIVSISERSGNDDEYPYINLMLPDINSAGNEYAPYIYHCVLNEDYPAREFILFYSQEQDNMDIKFMVNARDLSDNPATRYVQSGPFDVHLLNSNNFNEGYISISGDYIYYCSDMAGNFDIYYDSIPGDPDIIEYLTGYSGSGIQSLAVVNCEMDDKCPYVSDSFMVFSSNRPDGLGGYDLWYSRLSGSGWSEPENFGSEINTAYDEFRPVFIQYKEIKNDLMIFSSNRPGGQGGYDLYYVGITEAKNK